MISATLTLYQFGNSNPQGAEASRIQVLTVGEDWNEATITWNNAPLALESIDTRLDPVARSVRVRAALANPDGALKPGMFLTVDLQRDRGEVLVAPEEAIIPERDEQYVFQVVDGKAVKRQVTLGRRVPAAKATAVMKQRDYCIPEDIVSNVLPVCAHRVISKTYMHAGDPAPTRRIVQQVLETVPGPA